MGKILHTDHGKNWFVRASLSQKSDSSSEAQYVTLDEL